MSRAESILVVAAHPDDEVLGCGGAISRWASEGFQVNVLFLADGTTSRPDDEPVGAARAVALRAEAAKRAGAILGTSSVEFLSLPDNRLDGMELLEIVRHIEAAVRRHMPAMVVTHHAGDVNVDHRIAHQAVVTACRPQPGFCVRKLLFFEVPSSTEWQPPGSALPFLPNYFVDITQFVQTKIDALNAYGEELREFPHPRSIVAIEGQFRWRGATVGVSAAEAFVLGRELI
jgi:LmbE family N-acetylglucosaminyl deacetylase